MRVLVLSGSTRPESYNTRLAHLVARAAADDGVTVVDDLDELPFFDQRSEAAGWPAAVARLRDAVEAADLVVVVTPEYNGTHPGVLANAVDWLSRPYRRSPLRGTPVVVLSASPGAGGGRRAAAHLRSVLSAIGAEVAAEGLALGRAEEALSPAGSAQLLEVLREVLDLPRAADDAA